METLVGNDGRVIDCRVLSGPQDKQSLKFLDQFLYFGVYMAPATFLDRPTVGTVVMILSFYPTTNDRIDVSGSSSGIDDSACPGSLNSPGLSRLPSTVQC